MAAGLIASSAGAGNGSYAESAATTETSSVTLDSQDLESCSTGTTQPILSSTRRGVPDAPQWPGGTKDIMEEKEFESEGEEGGEGEGEEEPCDLGPITMPCCQAMRNTKVVLVCLCLVTMIQVRGPQASLL